MLSHLSYTYTHTHTEQMDVHLEICVVFQVESAGRFQRPLLPETKGDVQRILCGYEFYAFSV